MALPAPAAYVTRRPEIQVGDFIQYRYLSGHASISRTTDEVKEVLDGGSSFITEIGHRVPATQISAHIPLHEESEDDEE